MRNKTLVGAFDRLPDEIEMDNLAEHLDVLSEMEKEKVEDKELKTRADKQAKQRRAKFLKS